MQLETETQHQAPAAPPSVHRRAVIIWLSIYPLVTVAQLLLRPVIGDLPVPLGTLVMTVLVVPVAVYLVVPLLTKANAGLTRRRAR